MAVMLIHKQDNSLLGKKMYVWHVHTEYRLTYIELNFSPGTLDPGARTEPLEFREEIRLNVTPETWKRERQKCTSVGKRNLSK